MKYLIIASLFCFSYNQITAQTNGFSLTKSSYSDIYTINIEDMCNLAKNSKKDIIIFHTYSAWCAPCMAEIPEIIKMAEELDVDFYALLAEGENWKSGISNALASAVKHGIDRDNIVILSDSLYNNPKIRYKKEGIIHISNSRKNREKYVNFIAHITPPQFESIAGNSNNILLNKKGEVILVTDYKDSQDENGKINYELEMQKIRDYVAKEREKH